MDSRTSFQRYSIRQLSETACAERIWQDTKANRYYYHMTYRGSVRWRKVDNYGTESYCNTSDLSRRKLRRIK